MGFDAGETTITVTSGTVSSAVAVVVTRINPGTLSAVDIPGFANNVDVAGNYAYVAAGSAGLVVVDVTDRRNPSVIAILDTPGNANDVRVVGTTAYVADGESGLQIIDISTPSTPSILGSLDTPGNANDVVVYGPRAYVADGPSGLQIIDVSNASSPATLGSVDTPGTATGVDVSGDWVVVADGLAVRIIDAAIPAAPTLVGSLALPTANALDLEVRQRFAYVATSGLGLQVMISAYQLTRERWPVLNFFNLNDVALADRVCRRCGIIFTDFLPIFDLDDRQPQLWRL